MTCIKVHIDSIQNKVGKLSYQKREPYTNMESTDHGSYILPKMNKETNTKVKCFAKNLYIVPSTLIPCEPIWKRYMVS